MYYVYSSRVRVLSTKLSLVLSSSLSLSLFFSNHHRNTKRKHTTTTNSEEKHLFLKTIIEREKSSEKFSPCLFTQKKTQKSHVTERKSAEKQPTPLMNTFALVVFITSPRHSLKLHARDRHKQQHKQE
jgi:hypothetical protein